MGQLTHGMNIEQVEELGRFLKQNGEALQQMATAIDSRVRSSSWTGPDADRFGGDWWPKHRAQIAATAREIDGLGQSALNNAAEQQRASGAGGALSPAGGSGGVAPVCTVPDNISARIPNGSHAATSEYLSEIQRLSPGEMAYRRVSDGPPPRYIVMLRGVDLKSNGPNDPLNVVQDGIGMDSEYQRQIREMLSRLPADAEIGVIGHSQGGIAAVEVAQGDHRIKDILTLGSPVDEHPIRKGVNHLSIVNSADYVPKLEPSAVLSAHLRAAGQHGAADAVSDAGNIVSQRNSINEISFSTPSGSSGVKHGIMTSYLPAVDALESGGSGGINFDGGDFDAGAGWISDFESKYGGGAGSGQAELANQPQSDTNVIYTENETIVLPSY